jgi:outer membrane protein TolC
VSPTLAQAVRTGLLASGVLCAAAATAGAQEPLRLTLEQAQARAVGASHRLAEVRALSAAAGADVAGAEAAVRPAVAFEAGFTRTNHVAEFVLPASAGGTPRVLYPDVPDNYRTRLGVSWPIYTGGRAAALARAARAAAGASDAEVAMAEADLRLEVARVYWALVSSSAAIDVLARGVDRAEAHLAVARERFDAGLAAPDEVALARAQASRQALRSVEARAGRDLASAGLARLVGEDLARPIEAAEPLGATAAPAAPLAPLVEEALTARDERRALELRLDAAVAERAAAALTLRPTVAVVAGVDLARPNPRLFPRADRWEDSWDAGVNLTWPLWDGGRRDADVERASQRAEAVRARLAEFDSLVALEIQGHRLAIDTGRAAVAAAEDITEAITEARRVVGERYAAGVALQVEVLDADVALVEAELERTQALAALRLAEAELERARGR